MTDAWHIRLAAPADAGAIIELTDEASAWLVEHGLSDQWGPEPHSAEPSFVARVSSWIRDGEASVAVDQDGEVLGYSIVGRLAPPYYDPEVARRAVEDAMYVYTLAGRMTPASRGVGRTLLASAVDRARAAGLTWVRLDCWAENPRLRAYYESLGFAECDAYVDDGWRGIVMQRQASRSDDRI